MKLLEILKRATGYLAAHGSTSPRLDAELLLAHSLGVRRLDLYLQFDRVLTEEELAPYRELTGRRGQGEPVAYLVGRREFMALDFIVSPDVLVPQPDTEVLVQRAVEWGRGREGGLRFADVGTGSGCIAVAVAHYLPRATVDAVDISPAAIAIAERNSAVHGVQDRVQTMVGDLSGPLAGPYDAVLANLPYLREGADLPAEVRAQPALALYGGAALINRLLAAIPALLAPDGIALLEIDPSILHEVQVSGFSGSRRHRDLAGQERVLEAWM